MKKASTFTRRTILKGITASSLVPLLGSNLIGCSGSNNSDSSNDIAAAFNHGVASGDPLSDRVILWTRLTPETEGEVGVDWEIATDEAFDNIVGSGGGTTSLDVDYTVKVDADGLDPATTYYYRFTSGDTVSPVGTTRTAALGTLASARFAVISCSNYPTGYFHVYREVAAEEVDAVLHLGDYIYEYDVDGYASGQAAELGRVSDPENEILTLRDYRTRYAQYRSDSDLQACHRAHPFIVVWDDHEIANDAWREGAENHDPESEGSYEERRAAAIQVWYEWLPVRPPASEREIIYRSFQYGDLIDLIMLDTRSIARDLQISYADFATGGIIDTPSALAALNDSNRTLLGRDQLDWLMDNLTNSTARWQVLGQQVLMGRMSLPEPATRALSISLGDEGALAEATGALLAAVAAKNKSPDERTDEEQALLDSAIPYNPDAWDGYGFERDQLLNHAAQIGSRMVVLAGDTHNAWASQLTTADGTSVGVEFATASVTSPGAEDVLGADNAALFSPIAVTLIDDLKYANLINRGYLTLSFDPNEVTSEWHFISAIDTLEYTTLDEAKTVRTVSRDDLLLA
ncbi:MAG: alkaline phosphatase D family protein [Pseudomonadota bacterium]